jgi:predicted MFS family arabinose efflux permease
MGFPMLTAIKRLLGHGPSFAVAAVFFVNAGAFASWLPRIPEIKAELGLTEGMLGLALLGMPVGLLIAMSVVGWAIVRFGTVRVMTATLALYSLSIILPPLMPGPLWLALALVVVGFGNATMDVAMNVEAAAIESKRRAAIMGACHGTWSLGAMTGAAVGGLAAQLSIPPVIHLTIAAAGFATLGAWAIGRLAKLPVDPAPPGPAFALPPRRLLGLGLIGFAALLAEGAMADWSAVFLRTTLGAEPWLAGGGFAAFALAMAIGRFQGDVLVERFGNAAVLSFGGVLAAVGMVLGPVSGHPPTAVFGFVLVGFGIAAVVPILFRAAASTPGIAPGTAIAAVATTGYLGFLAGPPMIGLLADRIGLGTALAMVALLLLAMAVAARPALAARR